MKRGLAGVAVVAALMLPSLAQAAEFDSVDQVVECLRTDPVCVDSRTSPTLSDSDMEDLRREIDSAGAGPVYVTVVPGSLEAEAGGSPDGLLREIHDRLGRQGTYALIVGRHFRAGSDILQTGVAGDLARMAIEAHRLEGAAAVLDDFVRRVAQARENGGAPGGDGEPGGSGIAVIAVLAAVGGGIFLLHRRRARRREQQALEEVREAAREDLVALADDVQKLEDRADAPGAPPEAKEDYQAALERYGQASSAFDGARRPEDMAAVTEALEEGRYRMACAEARLDGRHVPERRPPCFFDPRHGPSTRDVQWAPPEGTERAVPACEACALDVDEGREPAAREVVTGGRRVPYYAAPAYFSPWAGGFFGPFGGGGFLSGLFVGELLGGGFGGVGGGWGSYGGWGGYDSPGDGGGGFGDFGGGGGDFGGGDFGGGGGDF